VRDSCGKSESRGDPASAKAPRGTACGKGKPGGNVEIVQTLKTGFYLNFQTRLDYPKCFFTVILIGLKKFATLLPNYCLAETPQPLAARRLGRQSVERERISEINWNVF